MNANYDSVKKLARNLQEEEPRDPEEELGGFPLAARCLDKCRAALAGTSGDFIFGCPMDQKFFAASGIDQEEFKDFVATGAGDQQVDAWIREHSAVNT